MAVGGVRDGGRSRPHLVLPLTREGTGTRSLPHLQPQPALQPARGPETPDY